MRDLATRVSPLRMSRLPALLACPWSAVVEMTHIRPPSAAADTGSAAHAMIEEWYRSGFDLAAAVNAAWARIEEFPAADREDAERLFRRWATPANQHPVRYLGEEVRLTLPAGEGEEDVVLVGHADLVDHRGVLIDFKTGRPALTDMVSHYRPQLAAYQVALTAERSEIVRLRGHAAESAPVFGSYAEAKSYLEITVVPLIRALRRGERITVPGNHCFWCLLSYPECKDADF